MKFGRAAKVLLSILMLLALCLGGSFAYLSDYYHADAVAVEALAGGSSVAVSTLPNGSIVFAPENAQTGILFYPGGKVEETAYAPLMQALAERGILCVLVKMPFRLAVLDRDAADGIPAQFAGIAHWYMAGHSLGGAMAASYAAEHPDDFDGLILLAAYSTADLRQSGLSVLSLYGSEDGVLNRSKYDANLPNLPQDTVTVEIPGGCHAGFAAYGPQRGDGVPAISREEQILFTADQIRSFIPEA